MFFRTSSTPAETATTSSTPHRTTTEATSEQSRVERGTRSMGSTPATYKKRPSTEYDKVKILKKLIEQGVTQELRHITGIHGTYECLSQLRSDLEFYNAQLIGGKKFLTSIQSRDNQKNPSVVLQVPHSLFTIDSGFVTLDIAEKLLKRAEELEHSKDKDDIDFVRLVHIMVADAVVIPAGIYGNNLGLVSFNHKILDKLLQNRNALLLGLSGGFREAKKPNLNYPDDLHSITEYDGKNGLAMNAVMNGADITQIVTPGPDLLYTKVPKWYENFLADRNIPVFNAPLFPIKTENDEGLEPVIAMNSYVGKTVSTDMYLRELTDKNAANKSAAEKAAETIIEELNDMLDLKGDERLSTADLKIKHLWQALNQITVNRLDASLLGDEHPWIEKLNKEEVSQKIKKLSKKQTKSLEKSKRKFYGEVRKNSVIVSLIQKAANSAFYNFTFEDTKCRLRMVQNLTNYIEENTNVLELQSELDKQRAALAEAENALEKLKDDEQNYQKEYLANKDQVAKLSKNKRTKPNNKDLIKHTSLRDIFKAKQENAKDAQKQKRSEIEDAKIKVSETLLTIESIILDTESKYIDGRLDLSGTDHLSTALRDDRALMLEQYKKMNFCMNEDETKVDTKQIKVFTDRCPRAPEKASWSNSILMNQLSWMGRGLLKDIREQNYTETARDLLRPTWTLGWTLASMGQVSCDLSSVAKVAAPAAIFLPKLMFGKPKLDTNPDSSSLVEKKSLLEKAKAQSQHAMHAEKYIEIKRKQRSDYQGRRISPLTLGDIPVYSTIFGAAAGAHYLYNEVRSNPVGTAVNIASSASQVGIGLLPFIFSTPDNEEAQTPRVSKPDTKQSEIREAS